MTRDELNEQIGVEARRFEATQDPRAKDAVVRLSVKLAELNYVEVLEGALSRCSDDDLRSGEVDDALNCLESRATPELPFQQLRRAQDNENEERRWYVVNAALNSIKRALGIDPAAP